MGWKPSGGGGGGGTVTSVSGTANEIAVANPTTTPVISIPNNPTLPGTVTETALALTGLTGAANPSRYVGATVRGAPTAGTFAVGDQVVDQSGAQWVCIVAGTPGTWVQSGAAAAASTGFKNICDYATAAALPANTYNNGTNGAGASLTANANGALSVDGQAVAVGQRILVKNEAAASHNGIYIVTAAGDVTHPYILTRAADYDGSSGGTIDAADLTGVSGSPAGTANDNTLWLSTVALPITVGTGAITWSQVPGNSTIIKSGGGGSFKNPMTAQASLISSAAKGVPIEVKAGAAGQLLAMFTAAVQIGPYDAAVLVDAPFQYWKLNGTGADSGSNPQALANDRNGLLFGAGGEGGDGYAQIQPAGSILRAFTSAGNVPIPAHWTVEFWINLAAAVGNGYIVGNASGGAPGGCIALTGAGNAVQMVGSATAGGAIPLNTWTHIAVTNDGTTIRYYKNGVLDSSGANDQTGNFTAQASVGTTFAGGNESDGMSIGRIAYYSGALSASRILAHYQAASAGLSAVWAGDTAFTAPILAANWANTGGGAIASGFRKMPDGSVRLRGRVTASAGAGTTIFTLPPGYRPSASMLFSDSNAALFGTITVNADGTVVTSSAAVGNVVGLDGIAFDVL